MAMQELLDSRQKRINGAYLVQELRRQADDVITSLNLVLCLSFGHDHNYLSWIYLDKAESWVITMVSE